MRSLIIFIVYLTLAFASFGYARHHYVEKHSLVNPFNKSQSVALVDKSLFGDWVKEEWVLAIVLPAVLIVAGLVTSQRK